jgi:circadian clock protein KaiC
MALKVKMVKNAKVALATKVPLRKIVRLKTGFPRMDAMLQGGLPENTITLLSGACGTGKSTFAMQFIYHGAKYCNEPGVYVSLEESPESIVNNMSMFGWDIHDLIEQKKIMVIKPEIYKFDSLKQVIADSIEKIGAKRLVVDSYSVLLTYFSDANQIRNGLVQLDREIKKIGCTAIVISDIKDNAEIFSTTGVEEFIVDGVIVLSLMKDINNQYSHRRTLSIRKMRATRHPLSMYNFDITSDGIAIGDALDAAVSQSGSRITIKRDRRNRAKHVHAASNVDLVHKKEPKAATRITLSNLKKRGSHSWKWKHL